MEVEVAVGQSNYAIHPLPLILCAYPYWVSGSGETFRPRAWCATLHTTTALHSSQSWNEDDAEGSEWGIFYTIGSKIGI